MGCVPRNRDFFHLSHLTPPIPAQFPRGLIYIEFSAADGDAPVGVWTNDGQEVNVRVPHAVLRRRVTLLLLPWQIEIGFYVQLNPNRLAEMYYKYENDYISVMEDIALNAVRVRALLSRSQIPGRAHCEWFGAVVCRRT